MALMTRYHSLPNSYLIKAVRLYQESNERNGCFPPGLLEEIIQRLEQLEDHLEETENES